MPARTSRTSASQKGPKAARTASASTRGTGPTSPSAIAKPSGTTKRPLVWARCRQRHAAARLAGIEDVPSSSLTGKAPAPLEPSMRMFLNALARLFASLYPPSVDEQYLAQAVDASDLEVRLQALERGRA